MGSRLVLLRKLSALVGMAALGLACSAGGSKKAVSASSTLPIRTSAIGTSAPATSEAPAPSTTTASVLACQTNVLAASLSRPGAAAGTIYYHLLFRNTASVPCSMNGYPGVSFVDPAGHQIGAAVPREHRFGGPVVLTPGGSAGALFAVHDAYVGSVPNCNPTQASGLRVYPPNQTVALLLQQSFTVCSNPSTDGSASISEVTETANLP